MKVEGNISGDYWQDINCHQDTNGVEAFLYTAQRCTIMYSEVAIAVQDLHISFPVPTRHLDVLLSL
jgi:hypothetical protein